MKLLAVEGFQLQDVPDEEEVVVDDGDEEYLDDADVEQGGTLIFDEARWRLKPTSAPATSRSDPGERPW